MSKQTYTQKAVVLWNQAERLTDRHIKQNITLAINYTLDKITNFISSYTCVNSIIGEDGITYPFQQKIKISESGEQVNYEYYYYIKQIPSVDVELPYEVLANIYQFLYPVWHFPVMFDGRYPHRYNALECTGIFIHAHYNLILKRIHKFKERTNPNIDIEELKMCSKNLEGEALKSGLDELFFTNVYGLYVYISLFIHDQDGSAFKFVEKFFPYAKEVFGKCHGAKNLVKPITHIGWKLKVKSAFLYCLKNCNGDPVLFIKLLDSYLLHWIGDHTTCTHGEEESTICIDKSTTNGLKLFTKIEKGFNKIKLLAEKFAPNYATSWVETINRVILVGVPKDKDYGKTYAGRVDAQLSRHTIGELWLQEIFSNYDVPLNEGAIEFLLKEEKKIKISLEKEKTKVSKSKKWVRKNNLKKKHQTKGEVYYKPKKENFLTFKKEKKKIKKGKKIKKRLNLYVNVDQKSWKAVKINILLLENIKNF